MLSLLYDYRAYVAVALALLGTLALTPVVRAVARRAGKVSRPRADRWAKKPTAFLGGIAIFVAVAAASLILLPDIGKGWILLAASALLFTVGLVDDLRTLKPYQKLLGQLVGSVFVIAFVNTLPWTPWWAVNAAITLFWLVGITNALNLLDNMDGLAAGVAAISGGFLAGLFFANGQIPEGFLLACFSAALLGFLVYNFNPASIFMGDCGSMFLGFFLAGAVVLLDWTDEPSRRLPAVIGVPILLLAIPIFDTTLVTVVRTMHGRSIAQGGRDHSSHRLVALGFSERRAVLVLYQLTILAGLLAVWVREGHPEEVNVGLIALFAVFLLFLGIRLGWINVYVERSGPAADAKSP